MSEIKVTRRTTTLPLYWNKKVVTEIVKQLGDSPTVKRLKLKPCIKDNEKHSGWDFIDAITFATSDGKHHMIFARSDITPGLVAHECLHTMNKICSDLGISHDPNNDEPMAYIMGWLVDEVYKTVAKDKASN